MCVLYDAELGINPQDDAFLGHEAWDWEGTPADKYPLLLNFHPLVIYRHQVLKQADVVLAMFLRGDEFAPDLQRRNFDYYDPITHRRLVAVGVRAVDHGRRGRARRPGDALLPTSRCTSTSPTPTATPSTAPTSPTSAGCGQAWCTGSPASATRERHIRIAPRLPAGWQAMRFTLHRRGGDIAIAVDPTGAVITVESWRAGTRARATTGRS